MKDKYSILYVDDEESNLRIFRNTFRREYNVFLAESAKEGMEILESEDIDIILSDQRMPEMTGVEFLQHALKTHPKLNRILITGFTDFNALQKAINEAKIFQYLQKPWTENDLRKTIEAGLNVYALEKKNKELSEELVNSNKKLVETNKELEIAKNKAEESDRIKSVFFSNISHEIRTPMNGILGFSRILTQEGISEEERKTYIDIIIKSGEQLMHIIDDIIEIARIEVSNIKITNNRLNINNFLNELIETYNNDFDEDQIRIKLFNDLEKTDDHILTDEFKLRKILQNLIDNSRKYTEKGFINVRCCRVGESIKFRVEDSGIGVSDDMKKIIFDRFRQEDENLSRKFGGLGLGLSIVKKNVELLGGKVDLESDKGKGSTFFFEFPYKKAVKKEITIPQIIDSNVNNNNQFKILIAEDEHLNFLFFKTILDKMDRNFSILHAKNGKEAVDISSKNNDIDLVLMDIKMPVMDGFTATREIKKHNNKIPIIVQTAYVTEEDREKARNAGCDYFITKPIYKDTLTEVFNKYLV